MSDSDFIHAVHTVTGLVSEVPRLWLSLFPLRELSDGELAGLRNGETPVVEAPAVEAPVEEEAPAEPVTAPEVPAVPVELPTVPVPVEEGLSNA